MIPKDSHTALLELREQLRTFTKSAWLERYYQATSAIADECANENRGPTEEEKLVAALLLDCGEHHDSARSLLMRLETYLNNYSSAR